METNSGRTNCSGYNRDHSCCCRFGCRRRRYGDIPGVDVDHSLVVIIFLTAIIAVLLVGWQDSHYDEGAPEEEHYYRGGGR